MKKTTVLFALLVGLVSVKSQSQNTNSKEIIMEIKKVTKKKVEFKSDGLTLKGILFEPNDASKENTYPAVVVGGSLTSVKEMMASTYAHKLAENGISALAFDYSHYGESEGLPRQFENPETKLNDLQAASGYLESLETISNVGALGICTTGGNMAYLGADPKNVKAIATVAAWIPTEEVLPLLYGSAERVGELRALGKEATENYKNNGEATLILAYHNEDQSASHVGPMEYYMDTNRGGGIKEWKNEFAVMSWENWLNFNPLAYANDVKVPAMLIHSDGSALPDNVKKFYETIPVEKELVWLEGSHFDFYDQEEKVNEAVAALVPFYKNQLK